MKIITVLGSKMQANMLVGFLSANGVEAFVNGSRDYASIVTGNDMGRYEISTSEDQVQAAQNLIAKFNSRPTNTQVIELSAGSLLKRAILFACMGAFLLPIVFNIASIHNLFKFIKVAPRNAATYLGVSIVLTLNLAAVVLCALILRSIGIGYEW